MQKLKVLIRQAVILAIPLLCAVNSGYAQPAYGALTSDSVIYSAKDFPKNITVKAFSSNYSSFGLRPESPLIDTVKCYFLEIVDTVTMATNWNKGYVVRENGFVKFEGKLKVKDAYLPVTSGIVESEIMYTDKIRVLNTVLHVVIVK